jgi:hypothetical protein
VPGQGGPQERKFQCELLQCLLQYCYSVKIDYFLKSQVGRGPHGPPPRSTHGNNVSPLTQPHPTTWGTKEQTALNHSPKPPVQAAKKTYYARHETTENKRFIMTSTKRPLAPSSAFSETNCASTLQISRPSASVMS